MRQAYLQENSLERVSFEGVKGDPGIRIHFTILQTDPSVTIGSYRCVGETSVVQFEMHVGLLMIDVDVLRFKYALACLRIRIDRVCDKKGFETEILHPRRRDHIDDRTWRPNW